MGYLDNRTITVDAILTKKGRELLSRGQSFFNITQFALADDEIDYHLWNENHPSGSAYYGYAIEQLPLLEAVPDETQVMRYKLISLPKDVVRIPVVSVGQTSITLSAPGVFADITPQTLYSATGVSGDLNGTLGYTAILHNSDYATLSTLEEVPSRDRDRSEPAPVPGDFAVSGAGIFLSDSDIKKSVYVVGKRFRVTAKSVDVGDRTRSVNTKITIIGNETGGSVVISLSVADLNAGR